jgi:hypothetical protein
VCSSSPDHEPHYCGHFCVLFPGNRCSWFGPCRVMLPTYLPLSAWLCWMCFIRRTAVAHTWLTQCKGQPACLENNWPGFNPKQVLSPKR